MDTIAAALRTSFLVSLEQNNYLTVKPLHKCCDDEITLKLSLIPDKLKHSTMHVNTKKEEATEIKYMKTNPYLTNLVKRGGLWLCDALNFLIVLSATSKQAVA